MKLLNLLTTENLTDFAQAMNSAGSKPRGNVFTDMAAFECGKQNHQAANSDFCDDTIYAVEV